MTDFLEVADRHSIARPEKIIKEVMDSLSKWNSLVIKHSVKDDYKKHVQNVIDSNINAL